jgi:hypothetical protein
MINFQISTCSARFIFECVRRFELFLCLYVYMADTDPSHNVVIFIKFRVASIMLVTKDIVLSSSHHSPILVQNMAHHG